MRPPTGARMRHEDRRAQLLSIGLSMLERVPFQALSIDDVAARAGISRNLLFHYFPSKQDYLAAIVGAAAAHVLYLTEVPEGSSSRDNTRSIVTALVRFIQSRRDNYIAVIRTPRSLDPTVEQTINEMYDTICRRMLTGIGRVAPDQATLVAARAWLAAVEEVALLGVQADISQAEIIEFSLEIFHGFQRTPEVLQFLNAAGEDSPAAASLDDSDMPGWDGVVRSAESGAATS